MKKHLCCVVILLLLLGLFAPPARPAHAAAYHMGLSSDSGEIKADETFAVTVYVSPEGHIQTYNFELNYDPQVLTFLPDRSTALGGLNAGSNGDGTAFVTSVLMPTDATYTVGVLATLVFYANYATSQTSLYLSAGSMSAPETMEKLDVSLGSLGVVISEGAPPPPATDPPPVYETDPPPPPQVTDPPPEPTEPPVTTEAPVTTEDRRLASFRVRRFDGVTLTLADIVPDADNLPDGYAAASVAFGDLELAGYVSETGGPDLLLLSDGEGPATFYRHEPAHDCFVPYRRVSVGGQPLLYAFGGDEMRPDGTRTAAFWADGLVLPCYRFEGGAYMAAPAYDEWVRDLGRPDATSPSLSAEALAEAAAARDRAERPPTRTAPPATEGTAEGATESAAPPVTSDPLTPYLPPASVCLVALEDADGKKALFLHHISRDLYYPYEAIPYPLADGAILRPATTAPAPTASASTAPATVPAAPVTTEGGLRLFGRSVNPWQLIAFGLLLLLIIPWLIFFIAARRRRRSEPLFGADDADRMFGSEERLVDIPPADSYDEADDSEGNLDDNTEI